MTHYIHGTHDAEGASLMMDKPGWILFTEAIGSDPHDESGRNYQEWKRQGFKTIIRLNNGYAPAGTIPHPNKYDDFAMRCANFVHASQGIDDIVVGNEPNHANERPDGQLITPVQYAKCFNLCYKAIKNIAPLTRVGPAAIAPWDATTKYSGNEIGDWIQYNSDMYNSIFKADLVFLHTYTHGSHPSLITSNDTMDPPFDYHRYHFRAYRDFLNALPDGFHDLPVHITETNQVLPWKNANEGWVQAAYKEIDDWNKGIGHSTNQEIISLLLYCSHDRDQWYFMDKPGVIDDFRQAVGKSYTAGEGIMTPEPAPTPPTPAPGPTPPNTSTPILWDNDLTKRGVVLTESVARDGEWEWSVVKGEWYDVQQAQGRVNVFVNVQDEQGNLIEGVRVKWYWGGGGPNESDIRKTEIKRDPWLGHPYSLDFGMSAVAPSYGVTIVDGPPSEILWGMGLGDLENPHMKMHTSYEFTFRRRLKNNGIVPIPPEPGPGPTPPDVDYIYRHPCPGAVITQHFYQNPGNYAQFGMPGHNGTDFGGKAAGTPILAVADGVVVYSERDAGYGWYVRLEHTEGSHHWSSMYCHLQEKGLAAGTSVKAGQQIGKLGSTGNSTGPHLHLEVRLLTILGAYQEKTPMPKGRVDPETYLFMKGLDL